VKLVLLTPNKPPLTVNTSILMTIYSISSTVRTKNYRHGVETHSEHSAYVTR